MSDLPDAPWVVESWYTGNDPDGEETPFDRCSRNDFLDAADNDFGWKLLAWELDTDPQSIEFDENWQDIWTALDEKTRKRICKMFEEWNPDAAADMYNEYWRRYKA